MTDSNKPEENNIAIDSSKKKEQHAVKETRQKTSLVRFGLILTGLISLSALIVSYLFWQDIRLGNDSIELKAKQEQESFASSQGELFAALKEQIQSQLRRSDEQNKALNIKLVALEKYNAILEKQIHSNSHALHQDQRSWQLKELQYILRIAQQRLILDRDIESARAALEASDKRLGEINQIDFLPLRKVIASQLEKLASYPTPDYVGLQLKLDQLIIDFQNAYRIQARHLPKKILLAEETENKTNKAEGSKDPKHSFLEKTLTRAKHMLNENVTLHQQAELSTNALAEQELLFSLQVIQGKLAAAKRAVSRRNDAAYKQQLESAIAWLTNESQLASNPKLVEAIKKLLAINLEPSLPDISAPYKMLEKLSMPDSTLPKENAISAEGAL